MENPEEFKHFFVSATTEEKGTQQYECTPENTVLYVHHPDNDEFDHIFRVLSEDETPEEYRNPARNLGAFLWRAVLNDEFDPVASAMIQSYNFDYVYRRNPTDADRENYYDFAQKKLGWELDDIDPNDFA